MSESESRDRKSRVSLVESSAKLIAIVGTLVAVLSGINQLWTSNVQRARELRWNQARTAHNMIETTMADPGWEAFRMMDWDDEGREYMVNGEPRKLNVYAVYAALEREESDATDHYIIDRFDQALFRISQLEAAVRSELVRFEDVQWPLTWYAAERMCPRKQLFEDYMRQYAPPETLQFFERLEEWHTCGNSPD